jgi:hypothetical protein
MEERVMHVYKQLLSGTKTILGEETIKVRVPQGSILSPIAFAFYMNKARMELREFVMGTGGLIVLYADDLILITESKYSDAIFRLLGSMGEVYGLKVNKSKTRHIAIGKKDTSIVIEGVEQVDAMEYLGINIGKRMKRTARKRLREYVKLRCNKARKFMQDKMGQDVKYGVL